VKLGILSDTHNHIENTFWALELFRRLGVRRLIHCGDISTPAIVELFEGFHTTFVFGNIDQYHADMMQVAKGLSIPAMMGYHYTANIDGVRVAACHGDITETLDGFIKSGQYQYVFYGHTHLHSDKFHGKTRVINPGALGGRESEPRSICVVELITGEVEFITLDEDTA
jgi:putative phosphoesterase